MAMLHSQHHALARTGLRQHTKVAAPHVRGGAAQRHVLRAQVQTAAPQQQQPQQQGDPWKRLLQHEQAGDTLEVVVKAYNKGGLVVSVEEHRGFLPYTQLAPWTLKKGHLGNMSFLIGKKLQAKLLVVDVQGPKTEIILSERKAVQGEALKKLKVGDTVKGVVARVEEYGAFVDIPALPCVSGLVHKSEITWDRVTTVDACLQKGDQVNAKVIEVDAAKCRLSLSIKQLLPDPLKQTLDTVEWGPVGDEVPPEIRRLADALTQAKGVQQVVLTRQAQEPHHISQELQVFLTRDTTSADSGALSSMDDPYHVVVARLGPVLVELQLTCSLPRSGVKELLQAVVRSSSA